jgi:hypothetical protein
MAIHSPLFGMKPLNLGASNPEECVNGQPRARLGRLLSALA